MNKYVILESISYGQKNSVKINILAKNLDYEDRSFSFELIYINSGKTIKWNDCKENLGGFEYDTQEDALDAAIDYIIDHSIFRECDEENFEEVVNLEYEDVIEEVPEDFELNMKK